jgi:hypothetical protein
MDNFTGAHLPNLPMNERTMTLPVPICRNASRF